MKKLLIMVCESVFGTSAWLLLLSACILQHMATNDVLWIIGFAYQVAAVVIANRHFCKLLNKDM